MSTTPGATLRVVGSTFPLLSRLSVGHHHPRVTAGGAGSAVQGGVLSLHG